MEKKRSHKSRNRVLSAALVAPIVVASIPLADLTGLAHIDRVEAAGVFVGGGGTASNPYLIENATQWNKMRNNLSSHFKLIADIDLTGIEWEPVGSSYPTSPYRFNGTLDGNGHKVINLTVDSDHNGGIRLFGATGGSASIKNLS